MPREAKSTDFHVDVEGIGQFLFARRSLGDVFKIRGQYAKLTGGNYDEEGNVADYTALAFVTIQTLLVDAPKSFNIETLDPLLDENFDAPILKIFGALRAKELSFRPRPAPGGEGAGQGNGEHVQPVVPPKVQPGADGSSLPVGDA